MIEKRSVERDMGKQWDRIYNLFLYFYGVVCMFKNKLKFYLNELKTKWYGYILTLDGKKHRKV